MSWDDLVGSDPNATIHPEDLFDPETTEIIEVDPSAEEGPMNYIQPYVGDQQYEIIEVDSSEPVITDWELGRPSEPVTIDLAAPSAERMLGHGLGLVLERPQNS